MRRRRSSLKVAVCCAALLLVALPVSAQDRGRIDVTAVDNTGALLPGAVVEITGPENRSDIVTGLQGDAHLLRLPVGTYVLRSQSGSFAERKIIVSGREETLVVDLAGD